MNESFFLQTIQSKAVELDVNPFLLLSGIEGLYAFRDVPINDVNHLYLDNLILTIFALRIGDHFHSLAEEKLTSENDQVRKSAHTELSELSSEQIEKSGNQYLQSFAQVLGGKSPVRKYHEKALEVAAIEINNLRLRFKNISIGAVILSLCRDHLQPYINFGSLFSPS